ncbi:hypothetical protein [Pedobacter sp. Leaf216]|uniref:hypothetical protein n=1 Tax=Pedobacter sp. Leaf216 TaxID=1735684 RepID=UPI000B1CB4B1|nr:hypothetical protein [Pedobacter sp. Leaf216]
MVSNIIRLSLGSLLIISFIIGCTGKNNKEAATKNRAKMLVDTCDALYLAKGSDLEFNIGCRSCHVEQEKRYYPKVPSYFELSKMDSLKLRDFIFISKHKGYFKSERFLSNKIKTLDSLSDCDRKNLIHYIKEYNRPQALPTKLDTNLTYSISKE